MTMHLNDLKPADGARTERTRVGRGIGSGLGKTCGRGHKGSFARKGGGKIKAGFEGGQTPMQRRLPKIGFRSPIAKDTAEVLLYALDKLPAGEIDFAAPPTPTLPRALFTPSALDVSPSSFPLFSRSRARSLAPFSTATGSISPPTMA